MPDIFEDIRTKISDAYHDAHSVAYPTVPVNDPGRVLYDPSDKAGPFVVLGIRFNSPKQLSLGQRTIRVTGSMTVRYFYRPGTGYTQSASFSDFLFDKFALRTIDGIVFSELSPYVDAGMEGWEGTLNVVPFRTEYFNI